MTDPSSLDEILAEGDTLLDDPNEGVFEPRHAKAAPAWRDLVSERDPCRDFDRFNRCPVQRAHRDKQQTDAGGFFILGVVMGYVAVARDSICNSKPVEPREWIPASSFGDGAGRAFDGR